MPIELVWNSGLDEGFDVKQFAFGLLERAQENLQHDGYVQSAVFLVTGTEVQCYSVSFVGYAEKENTYHEVVQKAGELNALAIVTLNDAFIGGKYDPETYEWGQAAANPRGECLFVTISGPGLENWTKEIEYSRKPEGIVFATPTERRKSFIGKLGEWSEKGQDDQEIN
jgi:hypothetical protein